MRITKKTVNGLKMSGYNDSNCEWVIRSTEKDGYERTERYSKAKFTLTKAFEFHSRIYANM